MTKPSWRIFRPILVTALAMNVVTWAFSQTSFGISDNRKPVNALCPVLTGEPIDPSITTTYQGHTIAFCCRRCLGKFEAHPTRYASHLHSLIEQKDDHSENLNSTTSPPAPDSDGLGQGESPQSGGGSKSPDPDEHVHEENAHGRSDEQQRKEKPDHEYEKEEATARGTSGERTEHQHAHETKASGIKAFVSWLGRFHPPMVNFPIAMLVGAAIAEGLSLATKRQLFVHAGRFCLWFGGLSAVIAGTFGWFFGGFHLVDDSWVMTTHRWLGTATVLWTLAVLIAGERVHRDPTGAKRTSYRLMLFIGATVVLVTGFFGGALVYGIDHYAW